MEVKELTMFEKIKAVIAEDDTVLVYSSRDGLVCCSAHIPRAKRILAEHPREVLAVYDYRVKDSWIKEDLAWMKERNASRS
jgi:hypothetical protein